MIQIGSLVTYRSTDEMGIVYDVYRIPDCNTPVYKIRWFDGTKGNLSRTFLRLIA
jgi:hypothetical protein